MAAADSRKPPERFTQESRGYCPVCGAEVLWTPTAHLWPSRRTAHSVLPSQSGMCSRCHRVLAFTVLNDPVQDGDSTTR